MASRRPIPRLAALVLAAFCLVGCGCGDVPELDNGLGDREYSRPPTPLYGGTELITLTSPHRCEHVDTSGSAPELRWVQSGEDRVVVTVLSREPEIVEREIVNKQDIVWVWTTAGDRSDAGWVPWSEGFSPDPQTGLPAGPPPDYRSIAEDVDLFWLAIWAWDDSRQLSHSSELRPFFLGPLAAGEDPLASYQACCQGGEVDDDWLFRWCRPLVDELEPDPEEHELSYGCMGHDLMCAQ